VTSDYRFETFVKE